MPASGRRASLAELRPFLTEESVCLLRKRSAARLGVSVETSAQSSLPACARRYRALLRAEVLRTVPREKDIDDELRYLCRVLIATA